MVDLMQTHVSNTSLISGPTIPLNDWRFSFGAIVGGGMTILFTGYNNSNRIQGGYQANVSADGLSLLPWQNLTAPIPRLVGSSGSSNTQLAVWQFADSGVGFGCASFRLYAYPNRQVYATDNCVGSLCMTRHRAARGVTRGQARRTV